MSLLVTLFLVLVNIFNFVSANAPKAEGLTAVETWVVSCIIHVFGVLAEYALILKLIQNLKREELMERRKEHKRFEKQFKTEKGKQNVYQPLIKQATEQTSLNGDDENNFKKNGGGPKLSPQDESRTHNAKIIKQLKKDLKVEKNKKLQENVDSIAMYLFPCIFLVFNSIYWPYYLFFIEY